MIYTAAEIKQIDRTAIQNGMPEEVLMERAASAIVPHIRIELQSTILGFVARATMVGTVGSSLENLL